MIHPAEASEQLAYVRRVAERAKVRVSQQHGWFLIWGPVWAIGYLWTARFGHEGDPGAWPIVLPIGGALTGLYYARTRRAEPQPTTDARPFAAIGIFIFGLMAMPAILLRDLDPSVSNAYYPYVFGLVWLAFGLYLGRVYLAFGAFLIAAALVSLAMSWQTQGYFLGAVVGGAMAVFGLWLRHYVRRVLPQD